MNPRDPRCAATPALSPCIKVCRVDRDSGLCVACLRTLGEISDWWGMRDDEKRAVLADLPNRRGRVPPSSGGA